jgi:hypothetical protein
MTYATDIMNLAIKHNAQRTAEITAANNGEEALYVCGWAESKIGEVVVRTMPADIKIGFKRVYKKTWQLGGKRISAANLQKALNA